jgi:hypothetical protein
LGLRAGKGPLECGGLQKRKYKMAKLYKLTDEHGQTHNETQWGPGFSHKTPGVGEMCGPGYIHAYTHPVLAVLLNPIHADFSNPRLWKASGTIRRTDGLKVGTWDLTTEAEIPLPVVTTEQMIKFAILCAKAVYKDVLFNKWADAWLDDSDRTARAARAAGAAAWTAAWTATRTAAEAAAEAAAWAAETAWASRAAAWAARAARAAAWASELDLIALVEEACQ